jgi:nucleotide-binding universal stress UspA family protein
MGAGGTAEARLDLENFLKTLAPLPADVHVKLVQHEPARAILTAAEEGNHSLIVLGSHGRTGISRAILGSVAEQIVRRAKCPVLVVHDQETEAQFHEPPEARVPTLVPSARSESPTERPVRRSVS